MIRIELFGVARRRLGTAVLQLDVPPGEHRLADVLRLAACRYPELGEECMEGDRLHPSYIINLGGDRFLRDPDAIVPADATLLILSADAGG